ncbi:MAG: hypothetical protein VW541_01040 [Pelagibacteraceae bacterium]
MGTLGHQGIFVIAIYFFLLIIAHYRLPSIQNNILAEYKAAQKELAKRKGKLKMWEAKIRKSKKRKQPKKSKRRR